MASGCRLLTFLGETTNRSLLDVARSSKKSQIQLRRIGTKSPLVDSFGRQHTYLRLSLTEKCNLRCKYCMPASGIELTKRDLCLSLEELKRLSHLLVKTCGINKIRLTGGEPTLDWRLEPLVQYFNEELRSHGLATVAITTNGLLLKKKAKKLKDLGKKSVQIY